MVTLYVKTEVNGIHCKQYLIMKVFRKPGKHGLLDIPKVGQGAYEK
jgi:hypothetical protein